MTSPDEPTQPQDPTPPPDEGAAPPPRDEGAAPPPRDEGAASPPPAGPPRRLTRSSSDRIIGGVAGGLGRHLNVDPIVIRVVFVLLCFAGGAGVLAYIALLAFVPSDDAPTGTTPNRTTSLVATVALVVAAIVFLGFPAVIFGPGLLVLGLIAVAVILAVRGAGASDDPGRAVARAGLATLAVLAAIGAALGVAFLAAIGGDVVIAVLVVVTGLVLVATAFAGGARWLIVPALVLALPLAVVAAGDIDIDGGIGKRQYRPAAVSDIKPHYELGMGELTLDLRDVDLPAGRTDVVLDLGVGGAEIRVADDVCVTSDVEIGAGAVDLLDRESNGLDVAVAQGGIPKTGQPELHVNADIGAGALWIQRGDFDQPFEHSHPFGSDSGSGLACP